MPYLTKKEKLSRILTREREKRGLTQEEVANAVGASLRNYQRWESGETYPQPYSLRKLQGFFGECINEVMIFDPQEHPFQDRILSGDQEEPEAVPPQEEHDDQSSETLSETDEEKTGTASTEPQISRISQRTIKHKLPLLCTILLILILVAVGIGFIIHNYLPSPS